MFVKSYSFKIRNKNINKLRKIDREAANIYKKYGGGMYINLYKKEKYYTKFLLLEFYKSKKDFLRIMEYINKNPKINRLWDNFLKIIINNIIEENFEVKNSDFNRLVKRKK